jgi:hypothetical protein
MIGSTTNVNRTKISEYNLNLMILNSSSVVFLNKSNFHSPQLVPNQVFAQDETSERCQTLLPIGPKLEPVRGVLTVPSGILSFEIWICEIRGADFFK